VKYDNLSRLIPLGLVKETSTLYKLFDPEKMAKDHAKDRGGVASRGSGSPDRFERAGSLQSKAIPSSWRRLG
jgi:hypothetical protein